MCHPDRSAAEWRACPERSRMGICCLCGLANHAMRRDYVANFRDSTLGYTCFDSALALLQNRTAACHQQKYFAATPRKTSANSHVKPQNHPNLCQTTTCVWHVS